MLTLPRFILLLQRLAHSVPRWLLLLLFLLQRHTLPRGHFQQLNWRILPLHLHPLLAGLPQHHPRRCAELHLHALCRGDLLYHPWRKLHCSLRALHCRVLQPPGRHHVRLHCHHLPYWHICQWHCSLRALLPRHCLHR